MTNHFRPAANDPVPTDDAPAPNRAARRAKVPQRAADPRRAGKVRGVRPGFGPDPRRYVAVRRG